MRNTFHRHCPRTPTRYSKVATLVAEEDLLVMFWMRDLIIRLSFERVALLGLAAGGRGYGCKVIPVLTGSGSNSWGSWAPRSVTAQRETREGRAAST